MPTGRKVSRRGAVLPLAAVLMGVMLLFVAFAVDIGYISVVATELQRTADAAALAGVGELPDSNTVDAIVKDYVDRNRSGTSFVGHTLEYGRWDSGTATFTPTSADEANAIRVTARRTHADGNPVGLFFGRLVNPDGVEVQKSAIALTDRGLCGPLVGVSSVRVWGNADTDSYNSESGSYHPSRAGTKGSVCSDGPIEIGGSGTVRGNANAGKGFETRISGNGKVTGSTAPRTKRLSLPLPDFSSVALKNDNLSIQSNLLNLVTRNLRINNRTLPLSAGTYYLNDLTLAGDARLQISGPTTIYLTGDLDTTGGSVTNNSQLPANLKIYMLGGTARVGGSADLHAVIYAPNTDVTLTGNGDLFGAIVGKTLTITGNGSAHYDEALNLAEEFDLPPRITLVQ